MSTKYQVGDTLFIEWSDARGKGGAGLTVTVAKVGRVWAECDARGRKYCRVKLDNGYAWDGQYALGRTWPHEMDYFAHAERVAAWDALRKLIPHGPPPASVLLAAIEEAIRLVTPTA